MPEPAVVAVSLVLWAVSSAFPLSAQTRGASSSAPRTSSTVKGWALLVRGTERVKGIPGFATNAFAAIYGEYRVEGKTSSISVWATQENLYFDPLVWTRRTVGGAAALSRALEPGDGRPLGNSREMEDGSYTLVAAELSVSGWTVFAALPPDELSASEADVFFRSFLERFTHFLAGAKLPTDVSFPATLGG